MIPDPTHAYIQQLQRQLDEMKAFLAGKFPDYDPSRVDVGVRGSVTRADQSLDGYVTPVTSYGANIREWSSTADDNPPLYQLAYGDHLPVTAWTSDVEGKINPKTGKPYVWYMVADGEDNFVREDVVTFTADKPIIPINAALWPAPTRYSSITNRHEGAHKGIDLATFDKRPLVYSGLVKGTVVQTFKCPKCEPKGTPGQRTISNAYGYGSHVIVRYNHEDLSPAMQKQMTGWINGQGWQREHLFVMYAHLSSVAVEVGQELFPEQAIGTVGSTGDSTGNHLHLEPRGSTDPNAKWGTMESSAFNPVLIFDIQGA